MFEFWHRMDRLMCRLFGHAWIERIYHDVKPAHFSRCIRCGALDTKVH